MAKRSSGISGLSITDLQAELRRRQRALPALQRKRAGLMAKVAAIDAQIAALGGSVGPSGGGARSARGRRGPRKDASLVAMLVKVLTDKTMGVIEAGEAVKAAGYESDSPNFRTMVNAALLKKQFFKRVARGQYTAV
jgi:hypothetical protein